MVLSCGVTLTLNSRHCKIIWLGGGGKSNKKKINCIILIAHNSIVKTFLMWFYCCCWIEQRAYLRNRLEIKLPCCENLFSITYTFIDSIYLQNLHNNCTYSNEQRSRTVISIDDNIFVSINVQISKSNNLNNMTLKRNKELLTAEPWT